jgi:hypothetical protein
VPRCLAPVVLTPMITLPSLDGALQFLVMLIAHPALALPALIILLIAVLLILVLLVAVAHVALSALIIQLVALIALSALATLVVLLSALRALAPLIVLPAALHVMAILLVLMLVFLIALRLLFALILVHEDLLSMVNFSNVACFAHKLSTQRPCRHLCRSAAMKRSRHVEFEDTLKPGNFFFVRERESLTGKVRVSGRGVPDPRFPKSTEKMRTGDRAARGHVSCCLKSVSP